MKKHGLQLMDEDNGNNQGGGGAPNDGQDGNVPKTFSKADLDAAVAAAVKTTSEKLSAKNNELLDELKSAKTSLKQFDGIDAEKTRQMLAAFENDQDLKDIAEGRHEDVFTRRTEKIEAKYKSTIEGMQTELDDAKTKSKHYQDKFESLSIDRTAMEFFTKHKGESTAMEDIALRARKVWRLEGDDIVARDEAGELITGDNGQITMEEWIVNLKKSAPHLFPSSQTPGAPGNTDERGGFSLSEQMQQALKQGDHKEYRKLRDKMKK